jgi:ADP-ribosylglycohydrolase
VKYVEIILFCDYYYFNDFKRFFMKGAIIGDIIGSRFEWENLKSISFELFHSESRFTDDSVLTIAVAAAILERQPYEVKIKEYALQYPLAGYGGSFKKWMRGEITGPYNSWGNGSAMRVSPIAYAFGDLETVLAEAEKSAEVTHNHPEGIKGAQALAHAIFIALHGATKEDIRKQISSLYGYDLDRTIDEIRPDYSFDVSCQGSVPEAIIAFLESTNFEDAIRLAISIGGDSDTIASMAGALAEAFYMEIPSAMEEQAFALLTEDLLAMTKRFVDKFHA